MRTKLVILISMLACAFTAGCAPKQKVSTTPPPVIVLEPSGGRLTFTAERMLDDGKVERTPQQKGRACFGRLRGDLVEVADFRFAPKAGGPAKPAERIVIQNAGGRIEIQFFPTDVANPRHGVLAWNLSGSGKSELFGKGPKTEGKVCEELHEFRLTADDLFDEVHSEGEEPVREAARAVIITPRSDR